MRTISAYKPAWQVWAWDEKQQLPTYRAQGLFLIVGALLSVGVLVWQSGRAHYGQISMILLLWLVLWLMSLISFFIYVLGQALVADRTKSLFWRYTAGLWLFELLALLYYSVFVRYEWSELGFWAAYTQDRLDTFSYCSFNLPVFFNALASWLLALRCQSPHSPELPPAADLLDDLIIKPPPDDEQSQP